MKTLLIAGYGDIARRVAARLENRCEIQALSRATGFDLDRPASLDALEPADAVLHCAPPPQAGTADLRTANLLAAFDRLRILPTRMVYIGTSGVYGDCGGALVDETRPPNPQSERAARRADAESRLALWCIARGVSLTVLRAPGIYDSRDRLPLARLRAGTPALRDDEDVYTNHIHADDLARCCLRALEDGAPAGTYNASDDTHLKMGAWFDLVADRHGLPRPPRIRRAEAAARMPPELLSFLSESRRLDNTKLKRVLGVRLAFPTVHDGLKHANLAGIDQPA